LAAYPVGGRVESLAFGDEVAEAAEFADQAEPGKKFALPE
jgi:hypothetical protein